MKTRCPYCRLPTHRQPHGLARGLSFGLPLSLALWWTLYTLIRLAAQHLT